MFIHNDIKYFERKDIITNDDEKNIWKYALEESGLKPFVKVSNNKLRSYGYLKEDADKIRAILDAWTGKKN